MHIYIYIYIAIVFTEGVLRSRAATYVTGGTGHGCMGRLFGSTAPESDLLQGSMARSSHDEEQSGSISV